jgi:predicted transcriptional regulator YdeE
MSAERFALLGKEENGEFEAKNGYEGIRSFMFSETQGFVIAHNPNAVSPYVCWQFTLDSGRHDYYWGIYGNQQDAIDGYNARLFVKFN